MTSRQINNSFTENKLEKMESVRGQTCCGTRLGLGPSGRHRRLDLDGLVGLARCRPCRCLDYLHLLTINLDVLGLAGCLLDLLHVLNLKEKGSKFRGQQSQRPKLPGSTVQFWIKSVSFWITYLLNLNLLLLRLLVHLLNLDLLWLTRGDWLGSLEDKLLLLGQGGSSLALLVLLGTLLFTLGCLRLWLKKDKYAK